METIKLANNIFKQIVFSGTPFSLALKNEWKYKNVESKDRSLITAIVGCSLRHYYLFQNGLKKYCENPSEGLTSLVFIGLSNSMFLKRLDVKSVEKYVQKLLTQEEFDIYKDITRNTTETNQLLPDDINVNSLEYLSFRYNTPLWLIKMWNKHYGLNVVYKLLKNNNSPLRTFVKSLSNDEIINNDFLKRDENLYEYIGQDNLKTSPLVESKKLFGYSIAMNEMNKNVDADAVSVVEGELALLVDVYEGGVADVYLAVMDADGFWGGECEAMVAGDCLIMRFDMGEVAVYIDEKATGASPTSAWSP